MRGVWMRIAAALLSAMLLALSFPLSLPPLKLPGLGAPLDIPLPGTLPGAGYAQLAWLAFIALIPLLEAVRLSRRPAEAFITGYVCGLAWLLLHWSWLGSFGLFAVIMLAVLYALPVGLFAMLAYYVIATGRVGLIVWLLPVIWTALEYLRSFGFWAFPWNLLGYSQVRNLPLIQIADSGGVYVVSFLIVLASAALFAVLAPLPSARWRWGHGLLALAMLSFALAYGELRLTLSANPPPAARHFSIALIQGGLDTFERWSENRFLASLNQYLPPSQRELGAWASQQLRARVAQPGGIGPRQEDSLLIVWPESALARSMDPRRSNRVPPQLRGMLAAYPTAALLLGAIGAPHDDKHQENGIMLLEQNGRLRWPYAKVRLVPYGEVVPFRQVARFLQYPWGDEDVTEGRRLVPLNWRDYKLGLMVCFDNVFSPLCREQVRRGAEGLILVTNNSWYKLHSGIRQHCDIDVLRAVEYGRPLARCSTTGWSHVIDPYGRVLESTSVESAGAILREFDTASATTPYLIVGDLFAQLCLLIAVVACAALLINGRSEGLL